MAIPPPPWNPLLSLFFGANRGQGAAGTPSNHGPVEVLTGRRKKKLKPTGLKPRVRLWNLENRLKKKSVTGLRRIVRMLGLCFLARKRV